MFRKQFPIFLAIAFLTLSLLALFKAKPSPKNERIYKIVREYSPYYLEKTLGGLRIKSKEDSEFKEEPSNMELFKRLEELEREWGKKHLKLKDNKLLILKDDKVLKEVELKSQDEIDFIKR